MTPEQEAKVLAAKRRHEGDDQVAETDPETYFLAEFGLKFGWESMVALLDNRITMEDAADLLHAARKVESSQLYDQAYANYVAFRAAQTPDAKESFQAFSKGMSRIEKRMKVTK